MNRDDITALHAVSGLDSEALEEAERFFAWATTYERRGLKIAADALRDEGRKAFEKFLSGYGKLVQAG